ncbi:MAG: site-specific integrase, partial [Nitrososphaeria archaeon]|nr:site-specific integrase [Nitrososphaeria archaeon]NIN52981.1 site-specific integrase [Nitrososphaeria archaeon]
MEQRETLKRFDEDLVLDDYSLWRRRGLFFHLRDLGMFVKKPFEEVTVQDLKRYVAESQKRLAESTMAMRKASIKRFYKWLNGGEEYP